MVCSRQLYAEALGNDGNPAQWEIREINDIMNNCSDWIAFSNPRHFPEPYRRQKGWRSLTTKVGIFNRLPRSRWNSYHYRQSGCSNNCPVGCRLVVYPVVNLVVGSIPPKKYSKYKGFRNIEPTNEVDNGIDNQPTTYWAIITASTLPVVITVPSAPW